MFKYLYKFYNIYLRNNYNVCKINFWKNIISKSRLMSETELN